MNFNDSHALNDCQDTAQQIEARLKAALNPIILQVRDDSRLHANHASAKASGGGHFSVLIVSGDFQDKSLVKRHQMIYQALEGTVGREIHAIQINAKTPAEYQAQA